MAFFSSSSFIWGKGICWGKMLDKGKTNHISPNALLNKIKVYVKKKRFEERENVTNNEIKLDNNHSFFY